MTPVQSSSSSIDGGAAVVASSFRDPNGFLFTRGGTLYRQVNRKYQADYERLMGSGLYGQLVKAGLLVPHEEVEIEPGDPSQAFKVIRPEVVETISYPYEWCFSQLKAAALATLRLHKTALEYGMWLKDASAYNIQFSRGRPVLIDTLSFEIYPEGQPWVAYRQFCQHFLAPLALMSIRDIRLNQLLRVYIDGVPLDLASTLLPFRTRLSLPLLMHIHLHASAQRRYAGKAVGEEKTSGRVNKTGLLGLVDSLESCVRGLKWQPGKTEWANYYAETNYTDAAKEDKIQIIRGFLETVRPKSVWDVGANTGQYSRLASELGIRTVAFDVDPGAVELNYLECVKNSEALLLPLVMDLTNPSPDLGWHNRERRSLLERGPGLVMALALVHHLAISNNVPLDRLAGFFRDLGQWLIIEFVPKEDSQVQKLLASRKDIFPGYTISGFEEAFQRYYLIREKKPVRDSKRILYLMEKASPL